MIRWCALIAVLALSIPVLTGCGDDDDNRSDQTNNQTQNNANNTNNDSNNSNNDNNTNNDSNNQNTNNDDNNDTNNDDNNDANNDDNNDTNNTQPQYGPAPDGEFCGERIYDGSETLTQVVTYYYDMQGTLVLKTRGLNEWVSKAWTYDHDSDGNLIRHEQRDGYFIDDAMGAVEWAHNHTYDGSNKLIQTVQEGYGGEVELTITYTYDGALLASDTEEDKFGSQTTTTYTYDGGLLVAKERENSWTRTYEYDADQNLVRTERTSSYSGAVDEIYLYAYEDGKLVEEQAQSGFGVTYNTKTYEYDADGNLTKVTSQGDSAGSRSVVEYDYTCS